ncbi:aminotransferase class III-fold pyridoxal phosphate-dependent enzyme [SAR202 cluster bacterium AD-804-J14_MRT_500m]|nr:aminotransferase class III-fold pyridoxal phosphate-dependent enzyme [SAR202 cluster bacterium AD-804-J14_MRT_500m]
MSMQRRGEAENILINKAARYFPGGQNGNMAFDDSRSFLVKRGSGSRIWDVSGNEYIDYLMGSGPMVLGHAHPSVIEAVRTAVADGSTFFTNNESAVLLAEEIVAAVPCAEQIRFTTSGTDACFQGLRIARSFRKRDKILKFEGGFHGTSDYSLISNPPRQLLQYPYGDRSSGGIPKVIEDLVLVAPYNDVDTTTAIIEQHHNELAAVIIEQVQRILAPLPGFLQAVRKVTAKHEIPLIFDEVVTGFRLAYGGAQEYYGITPDLAAIGKIVGGGYPLAAICGRADIMSSYDSSQTDADAVVSQIGTLNGNPVACAAGLSTLAELRRQGDSAYNRLWATGRRLREALETLCAESEIPAQTSGVDPVFDIIFTDAHLTGFRSTLSADHALNNRFRNLLQDEGVFRGPSKFYPSLAHTDDDLEQTISAFRHAITKLRN